MFQEISTTEVRLRQERRCEWCNEKLLKGERATRRVYISDGDFKDSRMHPECFDAMEKSSSDLLVEGWYPGESARGVPLK